MARVLSGTTHGPIVDHVRPATRHQKGLSLAERITLASWLQTAAYAADLAGEGAIADRIIQAAEALTAADWPEKWDWVA